MGEADFKQFMRLRSQLVIAAENVAREESLTPVLISTMSKHLDEQLTPTHKVVDVVDRANRKICLTLLRYNVGKPENYYDRVRIFARKEEDKKFQQLVYLNYKLEEFIFLLDVMSSVFDKAITNQPICNVLCKKNLSVHSLSLSFFVASRRVATLEIKESFFSS